jgi:MFS family permease
MTGTLFGDPDFRRLWTAGLISYLLRWLEILVFGVFAYESTGSAFAVASMLMLRQLPLVLFGVPVGALAARIRRRTALIITYSALTVTSIALLLIASAGRLEVWHLAAASFVNGIAWAGDNPLRRGLIGDIVGPARMVRAMALDVGASNASRLAGPGIGGLLLAHSGMPSVLLLTVALYAVALHAVLRLSDTPIAQTGPTEGLRATLSVGFRAVRTSPLLAATLWVTVLFNLFGWPALSMVPVIGRDRLGLGPDGVGLLASVDGFGTLLGTIALASLSRPSLHGRIYVCGVLVFLAMLPAFALSRDSLSAGIALLILGLGQSAFSVMQATIVFIATPPQWRVHAMGVLTMCIGTGPIGFLMLGSLADVIGAPAAATVSAFAGLAAMAATWRWWRACWYGGYASQ